MRTREIKFRIFNKHTKQMIYDTAMAMRDMLDNGFVTEDEHRYLMQYTGLKDKKHESRDVYEGDAYGYTITHNTFSTKNGHSTFNTRHIEIVEFKDGAFYLGDELLSDVLEYDDSIEHLGNIYENPELLGGEQND